MNGLAVIDYGVGNIQSVINACSRLGAEPKRVTSGPELIESSFEAIILPGVGAIGEAIKRIREAKLDEALTETVVHQGTKFLGICVGMQIIAENCEEFGYHKGLGWIHGNTKPIDVKESNLPLPHVGWNNIEPEGLGWMPQVLEKKHFYFCHSCSLECDQGLIRGTSDYGKKIVVAIQKENIYGIQCHPEKSSDAGELFLKEFLKA